MLNRKAPKIIQINNIFDSPIYLRQTINVSTRKIIKEIIDEQHRIRTIINFANNRFKISNNKLEDKLFNDLPNKYKENFLEYKNTK